MTAASSIRGRIVGLLVGFAAVFAVAFPAHAFEVKRVVSPGGIEAWLIEDHANPIVAVKIVFRGGAALEPNGKEGLARMTAALLDEGAGDMDSQAFQGALTDNSISLSFDTGQDSFTGQLKTAGATQDLAFRLLRMALTQPRFDEEPVRRVRSQIVAGLQRDTENPGTLGQVAMVKALFPGHPYGRRTRGTLESVPTIAVADMKRFVAERLAKDNLIVGVSGDIAPDRLAKVLDDVFGGLPAKAAPWKVPEVAPTFAGNVTVIEKAVPQSAIAFAGPGVKRDDPDFYAVYVMNHILGGGGFTSRLYQEVREKRGLAYSTGSGLYTLDAAGFLTGSAGTANARVAETIAVVREEWARMGKGGIADAELQDAKTYLTGSFPLQFSSTDRLAAILAGMQFERLGIDYLQKRNGYVEAVTKAAVDRVAARLLDPAKLTFFVVGDPKDVKSTN